MNAQRLSRLIRPHNLTSLFVVSFALLVLAFGLGAGAAQSQQDGSVESDPDERKFINKVPAHVPIKVKLRNEQTFKKKENKNWARELEVEIKNTGAKPIYYIYVMFDLPDFLIGAYPLAFRVKYGRPDLAFLETPLEPGDVPILPGETITLKIHESQVKGYEGLRDREGRDDPRKVELQMQYINFGDGTGFAGTMGHPYKAIKKTSAAPRREGKTGGCPPAPAARSAESPASSSKRSTHRRPRDSRGLIFPHRRRPPSQPPPRNDAWLALDRDGDGRVGDARELFGNLTAQPPPPAGVAATASSPSRSSTARPRAETPTG